MHFSEVKCLKQAKKIYLFGANRGDERQKMDVASEIQRTSGSIALNVSVLNVIVVSKTMQTGFDRAILLGRVAVTLQLPTISIY
jgi:hypothetical protein